MNRVAASQSSIAAGKGILEHGGNLQPRRPNPIDVQFRCIGCDVFEVSDNEPTAMEKHYYWPAVTVRPRVI